MFDQPKPRYSKFHDFANKTIAYSIEHPTLTAAGLYAETRQADGEWVCYLPYAQSHITAGKSRAQAVAGMLRIAEDELAGLKAEKFFHAEYARLEKASEIALLTTAQHALLGGMENADDTVGEGGVEANSADYWLLVISGYESTMDELTSEERALADRYDVDALARCIHCGIPVANTTDRWSDCTPCAAETAEIESTWERIPTGDAKTSAALLADLAWGGERRDRNWYEAAIANYRAACPA